MAVVERLKVDELMAENIKAKLEAETLNVEQELAKAQARVRVFDT